MPMGKHLAIKQGVNGFALVTTNKRGDDYEDAFIKLAPSTLYAGELLKHQGAAMRAMMGSDGILYARLPAEV
jgi:hypothetical protein